MPSGHWRPESVPWAPLSCACHSVLWWLLFSSVNRNVVRSHVHIVKTIVGTPVIDCKLWWNNTVQWCSNLVRGEINQPGISNWVACMERPLANCSPAKGDLSMALSHWLEPCDPMNLSAKYLQSSNQKANFPQTFIKLEVFLQPYPLPPGGLEISFR